jgi:HEAT repeat protein/thiol-disulfide isomerase/thioredoxin
MWLSAATRAAEPAKDFPWLTSLDAGFEDARQNKRPILVDVGAEWCGWCKKLDEEIAKPALQAKLKDWTLVRLDADKDTAAVRKLAVGPIPALRVISASGRTVASHDGYLEADALIKWLDESRKGASGVTEILVGEPKDAGEASAMVGLLGDADPLVREAAVHQLRRRPDLAGPKAVESFAKGSLAERLAVLELLTEWKAPLDGVDPWEPGSVTPARLEALRKWAKDAKPIKTATTTSPTSAPTQTETTRPATTRAAAQTAAETAEAGLPADVLAAARRDLALLLSAGGKFEVRAVRERLARVGPALLPEVTSRLQTATSDDDRQRLGALRYRLVASDALAAAWPDGFERLAAADPDVRRRAVDELAGKAKADDGALLLSLFADPDPLVRETSLRALQALGGQVAADNIIRLLKDPEPNVRAAVLKQLAESPSPGTEAAVIAFARSERDSDLVVHAVRVLRELKTASAADALLGLLGHESWRVRAETAEALGKMIDTRHGRPNMPGGPQTRRPQVLAAVIKLLDDPDGFVVSRGVIVLRDAQAPDAIEPLVKAAERRPELAPDVVRALAQDGEAAGVTLSHLRKFCSHPDPAVRAAAIRGVVEAVPNGAGDDLRKALADDTSQVRVAAAAAATDALEKLRPEPDEEVTTGGGGGGGGFLIFGRNNRASAPTVTRRARDMEKWLTDFRAGASRPAWAGEVMESLDKMLAGSLPNAAPAERIAAAVPLVALGKDDKALPVIQAAARQPNAADRRSASAALPWVPWPQRAELFKELVKNAGHDEVGAYVRQFGELANPASAELMWDVLAPSTADAGLVSGVHDVLRKVYLGSRYYDQNSISAERKQALIDACKAKLEKGSDAQRLLAMAMLVEQSPTDIVPFAERLLRERSADDPLKADAFHVLLVAKQHTAPAEATTLAVNALAAKDTPVAMRRLAVRHLATDGTDYPRLRGAIWLSVSVSHVVYSDSDKPQNPGIRPPAGLTAEMVRPVVASPPEDDASTAAYAGYLLSLFGDRSGFDRLVAYWRANSGDDTARRLVYRAVAAMNDDSLTPVLESVYKSMADEQYYARELYSTIRDIKGPNVTKLRQRMQTEVGDANLR